MSCWLEYPLDQPLEGDATEVASPFNFPPEGAFALFWFTDETFTKVLSALWNGAILTYPEEAFQVIWYFLQNVEVPVELCEQVATCFSDDPGFRQSVIDSLASDPSFTQIINNISVTGTPMTQPQIEAVVGDNCDEDTLFGGIVALIDQMNTNNLDFMQVFEVATNLVERASALVAAIPLFETLPFDDLIEFVDRFFNEIYENYESEITTSLLNEYKCDLFCMALENEGCGFTYENLYDYFKNRVDGAFTIESLFQVVIEALASGSYSGTLIADFMYMLQIQVMRSASNFLGVNLLALQTSYNIGELVPDHSWTLIPCGCGTPQTCDDFIVSEQGYAPVFSGRAEYHGSEGWGAGSVNGSYIWIRKDFEGQTITEVSLHLNQTLEGQGAVFVAIYAYDDTGQAAPIGSSTDPFQDFTFADINVTDGLIIYVSTNNLLGGIRLENACYVFEE